MSSHSPLPWSYRPNTSAAPRFGVSDVWEVGNSELGLGLALVPGIEANAEYIVRACNAYPILVSALREIACGTDAWTREEMIDRAVEVLQLAELK